MQSSLPASHPLLTESKPCADLRPKLSGALAEPLILHNYREQDYDMTQTRISVYKQIGKYIKILCIGVM